MFHNFLKDETGATAIEYALIAVLVCLALIGGATAIGADLSGKFESVEEAINNNP